MFLRWCLYSQQNNQSLFSMKKKFIVIPLIAILVGGGIYYYTSRPTQPVKVDTNDLVITDSGAIENRVDVVAKVALTNKESLTFKQTGKILHINVKEGEKVKQ